MKQLFEPVTIRGITVKNRFAVPPMVFLNQAGEDGYATENHIEHYRAMARGGFGLIIQEATCVSNRGRLHKTQLGIWEDGQVVSLKKIVSAVHDEGAKIFLQIHHAGLVSVDEPFLSPSKIPFTWEEGSVQEEKNKKVHELSEEEADEIVRQFINSGKRALAAGYDGVEIHGCHSYLVSQFLNRNVNQRKDRFGENRELFARQIIEGIRAETNDSFVIGIRLGAFEPTLEDGIHYAKQMEDAGADFIDVSYGFEPLSEPFKPQNFPYLDVTYGAKMVKAAVKIPVFVVKYINDLETAEGVLSETDADMIDVGRGALVNPNWVNDAETGRDTGTCFHCPDCMWHSDYKRCPGRIRFEKTARR